MEEQPLGTPLQSLVLSKQLSKYDSMQHKSKARILTAPVCNEDIQTLPNSEHTNNLLNTHVVPTFAMASHFGNNFNMNNENLH